jgi:hypothetical protein
MFKTSLSLVLLLASMGTALANQSPENRLITPTLYVKAPDNFACNLTNVSGQTGKARVRIISNGAVLSDSGAITVSPAHTANYTVPGLPNGGPIYCDFTVQDSKESYRGDAKLYHSGTDDSDFLVISAQ